MEYETYEKGEFVVKIMYDEYPDSPRNWDNLGTIAHVHRNYDLGDRLSNEEIQDIIDDPNNVTLPIYMYEHSGISISCVRAYPYNDIWDAGIVGVIYVSRDKLKEEKLDDKTDEEIENYLDGEIRVFDQYLRGEVYGYIIEDREGNHIDSCWSFYDLEHLREEVNSMIQWHDEETARVNQVLAL